jgi:hypothetical protein
MDDVATVVLVLVGFLALLVVYFLPTSLAYRKNHPQRGWILVCNLFAGGTGIGWIICLIWVLTYHQQDPQADEKREPT